MALKPLIAGQFYKTSPGGAGGDMLAAVYDPAGINAQLAGRTVANAFSANGAASAPVMSLTGTWFSGGSATTTKPQFLIEPAGTTSTNWNTGGTGLGLNAAAGFAGNILDLQLANARVFAVASTGATAITSGGQTFTINGSTINSSASEWQIQQGGGQKMGIATTFVYFNVYAALSDGARVAAGEAIAFSDSANPTGGTLDLQISRAGVGILGLTTAAVVTESVVSDRTLAVNINGVAYRILLIA